MGNAVCNCTVLIFVLKETFLLKMLLRGRHSLGMKRIDDTLQKQLTTGAAKESTLVVIASTNGRQLLFCWLVTPLTSTSNWG
jgi:hypothetical protein